VAEPLTLPGFVNAHSHAFQRALRGRTEGGDFWAWREAMLHLAAGLAPGQIRNEYVDVYREMRSAGYTAVGEFHYLGFDEAVAAAEAADEAGIEIVLLYVAYARGGIDRFRQGSVEEYLSQLDALRERGLRVGVAPHSVRACPRAWLEQLAEYAEREALPLHVHADEQRREIDECLAEHGRRPIELLAVCGCLGPRTTIVHATHADAAELDLVGEPRGRVRASGGAVRTRDRHLHWFRLERPHRSLRGIARAGGNRAPAHGQAKRRLPRLAPLLRVGRGRRRTRARSGGRDRDRP
jgi:formimidoylglutamate deiminase